MVLRIPFMCGYPCLCRGPCRSEDGSPFFAASRAGPAPPFRVSFLQSTRTLDTAQDAPELFEYLGYRSLGQPLWLMASVVLQSAVGSTGSPHIRGSEGPRPLPLYVEHFTHGRPSRY